MRLQQTIALFFLFAIIGGYSFSTIAMVYQVENGFELVDFPFDSEEQEESKKGKEKEKEKEYDEENKELAASQQDLSLHQLFMNQKRKGFCKHYTSLFIEVFTPPPDYTS